MAAAAAVATPQFLDPPRHLPPSLASGRRRLLSQLQVVARAAATAAPQMLASRRAVHLHASKQTLYHASADISTGSAGPLQVRRCNANAAATGMHSVNDILQPNAG